MSKQRLTDRSVTTLKPAPAGQRYEVGDAIMPGLIVRVTDTGQRTFMLKTRFPGSPHPTRRALGPVGVLALAEARDKARDWLKLIGQGIDPKSQAEQVRQETARQSGNTFAAMAEDFITHKLPGERKGEECARDIRNNFIPAWGAKPVTQITDADVIAVIEGKALEAPSQARNLLGLAKRIFQWAIDRRRYDLKISPAAGLKPATYTGEKISRDRTFNDHELIAFWRAVTRMQYPYGPVYHLLVLNALRLNEVADAAWTEFHPAVQRAIRNKHEGTADVRWRAIPPADRYWTIPADRMKGRNSKARAHVVPITLATFRVLDTLPLFQRGRFLFSTCYGEKPVWMSDKIKKQLDARMVRTLRAMAKRRGEDHRDVELPHWQNHDLRRVVRSGLSRLRITEEAREAVLAHARPGIKGTYDIHDYFDEKREALEAWADRLRSIVEPSAAASNVVRLTA
jgi:hypothetical protein